MSSDPVNMARSAESLAKNPLGIIALFLVLVYSLASLVAAFSGSIAHEERIVLVYFMVSFPILVLSVFAWLVSCHSGKLFGPSDFKNEENYVKMQLSAVASLATAAAKNPSLGGESSLARIVDTVREAVPQRYSKTEQGRNRILWVDDRPENNVFERQAFEAIGLNFSIALSTNEALAMLDREKFSAIISDMGRKEGPREGYVLLDAIRAKRNSTPLFFYASSNAPEHKRQTVEHGGQGCTNNAQELFQMVTRAIINGSA